MITETLDVSEFVLKSCDLTLAPWAIHRRNAVRSDNCHVASMEYTFSERSKTQLIALMVHDACPSIRNFTTYRCLADLPEILASKNNPDATIV